MKKFLVLIMSVMAVVSVSAAKKTVSGSESSPDFAFPQTVAADASEKMGKAMKGSRYVDALSYAMQLVVADNLVDRNNAQASIAMLDSIGALMPADYSAISALLQAQVYSDYFMTNRSAFSGRTLPMSPYPDNIAEWSRGLFVKKITELVEKANSMLSSDGVPLSGLAPILTSVEAERFVPSERDFIVYKSIDLLKNFSSSNSGTIPFRVSGVDKASASPYTAASGLIDELIDGEMESCRKRGLYAPLAYAMTRKTLFLDGKARDAWLAKCLEELEDRPESIMIINQMAIFSSPGDFLHNNGADAEKVVEARRFCDLARKALERWPEAYGSARLSNTLQSLTAPQMRVQSENQFASSMPVKINVSVSNSQDAYVLLFRLPESAQYSNNCIADLVKGLKPLKSMRLDVGLSAPARKDTVVDFGRLPYGFYIAVPSLSDAVAGIPRVVGKERASAFRVSDMRVLTAGVSGKAQQRRVYVVDAVDGKPVVGAKVEFRSYEKRSLRTQSTAFTDKDGYVDSPRGSWNLRISKGSDLLLTNAYLYTSGEEKPYKGKSAEILTDLAIYHPGDTVGFVAVAYGIDGRNYNVLPEEELTVDLRDANGNIVSTKSLVSDRHGRVSGHFVLPQSGLLGNWNLAVKSGNDNISWGGFQVADYKSPTFYVEIDSVSPVSEAGDEVVIAGKARTYSGMPVAGAQVKYDIRYASWWCWRGTESPDATFAGQTETGGEGGFEIRLDTKMLKDTPYAFGAYRLNVAATSPSGETQSAPAASFALGSAYSVVPSVPATMDAAKGKTEFNVEVKDILGIPASKRVDYVILNADGAEVAKGDFMAPRMTVDLSDLSSGRYTLKLQVAGAGGSASSESDFVIYRASDAVPAVESHLWVPEKTVTASKGAKEVEVTVGSSYPDSHILCYATSSDGGVESKWLRVDKRNSKVKVGVPRDGERKWLTLATVSDMKSHTSSVQIVPATADDSLEIKTESFRDKITPGDREVWKFSFTYAGKPQAFMPTMAVLSDKSLNAITPFIWSFSPRNYGGLYNPLSLDVSNPGNSYDSFMLKELDTKQEAEVAFPEWQTYGYSFVPYAYMGMRRMMIRGRSAMSSEEDGVVYETVNQVKLTSAPMAMKEAKSESAEEEVADSASGGIENGVSSQAVQLREIEHPLGFFMPMLETDGEGIQALSFVVPDYNTTWQLQLLGYTPHLKTAMTVLESTASKPVMVRSNPPRFLRTGDKASVAAAFYNASDSVASVWGEMEIIDPISGKVVASVKTTPDELAASESGEMSVGFEVPDSLQYLLLRVYARSSRHSDGEQTLIQVLPSSTPVIESNAFYLSPGNAEFVKKLPAYNTDATLTLQYCDNPVWYCVTALPAVAKPQSKNLTAMLKAYYGSAMAAGLTGKYPQIKSGLERILASGPKSNLSVNSELKTVELINTPWTNNAAAETSRIRSLSSLLQESQPTIDRLRAEIMALQNPDGGWSWCPEMESSAFMTSNVLLHFGMLKQNGYLGDARSLENALSKGRKYLDSETLSEYVRDKKRISVAEAVEWLYVRGFYPEASDGAGVAALRTKALDVVKNEWRSLGIFQKARAAVVLNREGLSQQAKTILESLRQNAVASPELGMRYENLPSVRGGYSALLTTAQVLEAFAMVQPESPCVDQLRQGLILQRETEDWGADSYTVDVVQAIMASGSEWNAESPVPQISLGGKPVVLPADMTPVGYYKIDIPVADAANAELAISKKSQGPAWGSMVSQYVSPILDVKQAKMPEISVSKAVYVVADSPEATVKGASELKVGQKVRVTLTISTTRDMDYVAVTDSRSACLEPADQTSGYTSSDGLWFYREVRDESTNLFIGFLPKGTHVISYDCYVDRQGAYSLGIATAQSQYAPQIVAHSAGKLITVK